MSKKNDTPNNQVSKDTPEEIQARIDFARSIAPKPPKHTQRNIILLIILVIVIAGGAIGLLSSNKDNKQPPKNTSHTAPKTSSTQTKAPVVPTTSYTSSNFDLSINYPDGWDVVDSGTGPMTITSKPMQLSNANGQSVTGQIILTIQNQGQIPAAFSAGADLAVLNSKLISYSQPSAAQTAQTYISFVQYASTTTKGGLNAIYVTGNYGYQQDQVIPSSDVASVSPLITITFTGCGNAACTTNLTPLTIESTMWNKSSFSAPILTMLESLQFSSPPTTNDSSATGSSTTGSST